MATSDAHPEFGVYVPDVTLAVARGAGAPGGSGSITWSGSVAHGQTLTINDSQSRFGTRTNVKPLYVNLGDGKAGSSLGRDTADYFGANAAYQTAIKAGQVPGGVAWDCDQFPDDGIGGITFDPAKPLIEYLERYRDYDYTIITAMRIKYSNKTGTINVGETLTGQTSGATGVVKSDDGVRISFRVGEGTIRNGGATFQTNEILQGPNGSVVNTEGHDVNGVAGLQETFNLKTNRNWVGPGASGPNNAYLSAQGANPVPTFMVSVENVGESARATNSFPLAFQWDAGEFVFENSSSPDVKDGVVNYSRGPDFVLTEAESLVITRSTANPDRLDTAYLDQISNGVGDTAVTVYGYLCLDDEYNAVYLGDAATLDQCTVLVRQPQTTWTPSQVSVQLVESQVPVSGAYLYFRTGIRSWVSDKGVSL